MKLNTKLSRRQLLTECSLMAIAAGAVSGSAFAATWPERTVRIILPFPAGGTSDVVARLLAERLSASLGQSVIVESKPGANGIIASDFVAKSTDGHTFLFASAAHASNASLYPKLPYVTSRDFVPVAQIVPPGPMVIAVHSSLPVRNLADLLDYARKNPGTLTYASAGIGNTLHLAGEMLSQMGNIKLLHVPYRGAAPALTDLAGGAGANDVQQRIGGCAFCERWPTALDCPNWCLSLACFARFANRCRVWNCGL